MARLEIDTVDREMAALFLRRMHAVEQVASYKHEHGLPIFDASREEAVIAKNTALIEDDDVRPYYVEFIRDTMKASRHYQRKMLEEMRVSFCGIEGAFASIAAQRIFPDAARIAYPDFESAYRAAEEGDTDICILPIENSTAGEVGPVLDLLFSGSLVVTGVHELSVRHDLLAKEGATLDTVKRVVSHPQALAQCAPFLHEHHFEEIAASNTAMAAKQVSEGDDLTVAAIASEESAKLYGLSVLARNICESNLNTTRFAVLSRAQSKKSSGNRFILMFTVRNEVGMLARAISMIGEHGYNMRCLRSRPMKALMWQYYFYAEIEGDSDTSEAQAMLSKLRACCEKLKVLGRYHAL